MAISPTGDLVLDVMRAADPESVKAARDRLGTMAAGRTGQSAAFEAPPPVPRDAAAVPGRDDTFAKFEAMVLQTFLKSMLPDDTASVYGSGLAGEMWQSLMAEKVADVMAERGGIGIADRVLGDYHMDGENKVPLGGVSPERPELEAQRRLSTGMMHEIQREITEEMTASSQMAGADATKR